MYRRIVKRLLDIALGIVAAPFVVLILLVVAPLIYREDKGPVFYNGPRVGRGGRTFTMHKLRSMRVNAPDLKMEDGSTYNAPDDPRQTRIGAFLRKTSLDELPQLLNVLKGDMSFIGPRPDLASEVALYRPGEERKLEVRPGISGYAQVYGRNALAWHDRLALDGHYVEHLSFKLDVRIFFKTFAVVFSQEGVYVEGEREVGASRRDDEKPETERERERDV
ncbi:MAG: sugar transferase [Coriobacteriales bacterium]|jgi:lipopolysaccharide/colanic/teichoic acid biosynthesis glycosyltransferase|nr:sugar transferase [Coriobacteriales bacterium]